MKAKILNEAFAEFCESRSHLDSLLSRIDPARKSKVALLLGAFLRRPWTLASQFHVQLAETPEEFWSLGFIRLKKHPGIHAVLYELWEKWESMPREGGRHDFPPALIGEWERDWGAEKTDQLARLLSQDPLTTIRLHRRAFEGARLSSQTRIWLDAGSLPKSRAGNFMASARVFRGFARVQTNELFQQGLFEIQDEGSQVMSAFAMFPEVLAPRLSATPMTTKVPGPVFPADLRAEPKVVIDACAGAGGKTLAMADLMAGRGRVFAYDVFERKIRNLKMRLSRPGENNVQALVLPKGDDGSLEKHRGSADVVLIDAPCSGSGVLRRNPDAKWNRKPLELSKREGDLEMTDLQREVLERYWPMVRPGGRLVYGVCTFNRRESVDAVAEFLKTHPDFEPEAEGFVGPYDTDGFFMASLKKVR
jgi:16S rRNA C967 or C1407 C5-methylase (RsmB/RsmF family)